MVVPALTPVTMPEVEPTVPALGLLLAHVPPAGVQFNVVVRPLQITKEPEVVTVPGSAITVTVALTEQLPSA